MTPIRLVSALGLLLIASTGAQAGSPVTATIGSPLPKLELGLSEVDYTLAPGQTRSAPGRFGAPRDGAGSPSLAQYLKAPAPYDRLLPQQIDDRGAGYRVWF